jgi:AcrR family transcriptional regulator
MGTEKLDTMIRQKQIAEVALRLVATNGMTALSVANIARHVGIVPSAIYRHFDSKEVVLDAVIDLIGNKLMENVRAVQSETDDPLDQLRRLLMRHIKLIRENRGIPRIVFSEDVYSGNSERKLRMYRIVEQYLNRVAEMISDGKKQGRIRSDIDPTVVSVLFLGLIQPSGVLWHLSEGRFDITKQARKAWNMVQEAIAVSSQ